MTTSSSTKDRSSVFDAIVLQRLEGLAALGFGVFAYAALGQSWLVFAVLFLAPALLALLGFLVGPLAFGLAAIWVADIGLDRMLGYGLKLNGGFEQTHLGLIGKARRK